MDLCVQLAGIRGSLRQQSGAKISHTVIKHYRYTLKVIAYDNFSVVLYIHLVIDHCVFKKEKRKFFTSIKSYLAWFVV